jgi:Ca2+-transporting ATPase
VLVASTNILGNKFNATLVHSLSASDVLNEFRVLDSQGLSNEDAAARLALYGPNELPKAVTKPLWRLILEQFDDKLVQILLGVAALSSVLAYLENDTQAVTEPVIILSILIINAAVGVLQSRSAEASLDALKKLQPVTACVLRQGVWESELPASAIVPGDILHLRVGDRVPADGRIIALRSLSFGTDESSLTGEGATAVKSTESVDASSSIASKASMVFSGTMVTKGGCYAVVTATSSDS